MLDHSADDWGGAQVHSDPEADPSARVIAIVAERSPGAGDPRDRGVADALVLCATGQ
jgi:hypothetical protein